MFFDQTDVIRTDTGERALSLKKFVSLVVGKNLFSKEKQQEFARNYIADKEVFFFYNRNLKFNIISKFQNIRTPLK